MGMGWRDRGTVAPRAGAKPCETGRAMAEAGCGARGSAAGVGPRIARAGRRAAVGAAVLLAGACAPGGTPDVAAGAAMIDLSDAINALRAENAMLQSEVDSLRGMVARQDTIVRRIAAATGVPVTPQ